MRVIFRLTVDLTDAERYRDAYHKLLDEVGVLAARNQLAESEANRLSQFNAEILGHTNPSQRIVYLDRVRRELAETKQVRCVFGVVSGTRHQTSDPKFPYFILISDVDCRDA
jgi:heme oxygenase